MSENTGYYVSDDGSSTPYAPSKEDIAAIGGGRHKVDSVVLELDSSYTADEIKVTVNSGKNPTVDTVNNSYANYAYDRFIGIAEIDVAYAN